MSFVYFCVFISNPIANLIANPIGNSDCESDFESNFDFGDDCGFDNLISLSYSVAAFSANLFGLLLMNLVFDCFF